jgi:hypothetical protein
MPQARRIPMKTCTKCGVSKELSEYYRYGKKPDALLFSKCKECSKNDARNNYRNNKEYYAEYDRKREATEKRRLAKREASARYRILNKEKVKEYRSVSKSNMPRVQIAANYLLGNAVRDRRATRKPCAICGNVRSEGHHHDYYRPLNVTWLCRKHHCKIHAYLNREGRQYFDITSF